MGVALSLAAIFLLGPMIGYWVVASTMQTRTKVQIGVVGVLVLALMPVFVLIFGH